MQQVVKMGHKAMLTRMDVESVGRIVPVPPDDRLQLGMYGLSVDRIILETCG